MSSRDTERNTDQEVQRDVGRETGREVGPDAGRDAGPASAAGRYHTVPGERSATVVHRMRSLASRIGNVLALGLVCLLGFALLGGYYHATLEKPARAAASAKALNMSRAQTEMPLPALGTAIERSGAAVPPVIELAASASSSGDPPNGTAPASVLPILQSVLPASWSAQLRKSQRSSPSALPILPLAVPAATTPLAPARLPTSGAPRAPSPA
ncbi:MAG: hypothetical protein ACRETB_06815, partial [Steroidobacteraceae bacterium]